MDVRKAEGVMPEPTVPAAQVRVVTYAVSCLPMDDPDAHGFTLKVERRVGDRWVVTNGYSFLGRAGTWSEGYYWNGATDHPQTDAEFREAEAGQEAWKAEHWHDLDTALRLAKAAAPGNPHTGITVADVLARRARMDREQP
jgi:hypothetical protein